MKNNWRLYRTFEGRKNPLILAHCTFPTRLSTCMCVCCLYLNLLNALHTSAFGCTAINNGSKYVTLYAILMAWCLCKFLHCNRFIFHLLDWYLFCDSKCVYTRTTRPLNGRWNCANMVFSCSVAHFDTLLVYTNTYTTHFSIALMIITDDGGKTRWLFLVLMARRSNRCHRNTHYMAFSLCYHYSSLFFVVAFTAK